MSETNTGGPAFPSTATDDSLHIPGMTLRDYFAAKIMQAIVQKGIESQTDVGRMAETAYLIADVMLKVREK